MEFPQNFKSLYFLIVKGPLNPNITSIGEKLTGSLKPKIY